MKINFKFLFLLFGLIVIVLSEKENKKPQVTKITITTTEDEVETEEEEKEKEKEKEIISQKNITKNENKTKNDTKKEKAVVVPVQKRDNAKSEVEKIKVTLFPLIIYFCLFLINFSDIFIVFTFSKILFRVSLIEIKLLVGLHILLNS